MSFTRRQTLTAAAAVLAAAPGARAQDTSPLRVGVGLFQPDREKNDATCRPLAAGETDLALLGPWAPRALCWPTRPPVHRWWAPSCTTASPSSSPSSSLTLAQV